MERICKIVTCGDVDSGKSTLLGRLLFNTNNIYLDQLLELEEASKKYGTFNRLEYGFLFDGLLEERKQQITIDVAHRFFNIKDTRFHILDCPGHIQYLRNFVVGVIEADVAILVVDSTKNITQQTLRHLDICKLFQVQKIIIAITKIDLVEEKDIIQLENKIKNIVTDVDYFIFKTSAIKDINISPIADYLYNISKDINKNKQAFALCVQSTKKIESKRCYQGISFGKITKPVKIYPLEESCNISSVQGAVETFTLDKEFDISRGYIITDVKMNYASEISGKFINFNTSLINKQLLFKYGTSLLRVKKLSENKIELQEPIYFCNITDLKDLGVGLLIDEKTKLNAGVFVITDNFVKKKNKCFWFTGFSGVGKTTLAHKLAEEFSIPPIILDGDEIRRTINYDLTLSDSDRDTNVKKIANLANLFINQGFNVIVACISKDLRQRKYAKELLKEAYVEILVESSPDVLKKRDTKGLYKNNIVPLSNYEDSPWEHLTLNTDFFTVEESSAELVQWLKRKNYL